jgi:predicted dehydrogenase
MVDPSVSARDSILRSFPKAGQAASLEQTTAPAGTLAIIASPPGFHATQTLAAFERGWHVLCEKPMASSASEAEAMIAAAQRHQLVFATSLYRRFFPASRYIQSLCRDWELGPLTHFSVHEGGPFRWPAGPSFFDRTQTRGGVLFDTGSHVFDLLGWWLGEPAQVRYADDAMGGLETNAFVQLSYAGGAQGRIHLSRDWHTSQQYKFVFERGIVTWKINEANGLTIQLAGTRAGLHGTLVTPETNALYPVEPQPLETGEQCFILQLANVIAAIAGGEKLLVSAEEALPSLKLVDQCYANRALVEQPWLTPTEAAHAHDYSSTLAAMS